jgi:hypothetical protein
MTDTISKLQRWLDLVAFLAGRRFPVSLDQLWRGLPAHRACSRSARRGLALEAETLCADRTGTPSDTRLRELPVGPGLHPEHRYWLL